MTRAGASSSDAAGGPAAGRLPPPERVATPWVAAYPPGVPATYRWPPVVLTRLLDDAVRDFPDGVATRWGGRAWAWPDVQRRVEAFASALQRLGVGPGARVALGATSPPVALAVAFATWRAGAVLVPVPPGQAPADRARLLAASRPAAVVVEPDRVDDWVHADPAVVVVSPGDLAPRRLPVGWWPVRRVRARCAAPPGATAWPDLDAGPPAGPPGPVRPGNPAALLPTRDRAGRHHLATLTHRQLVAAALQARLWVPDLQAGREVLLCPAPPSTAAGLVGGLLLATLSAATLVGVGAPPPPRHRRRHSVARPTLLVAHADEVVDLLTAADHGRVDLAALRAGLVVGGRPPEPVARRLRQASGGARVRGALAVPEAAFLTHANPVYGRADPARVGLPVTGTVAAVVDPTDPTCPVPDGRPGRLLVAGPQVMAGYWQDPEATRRVRSDGWLLTDHLAVRDATGAFAIVGVVGDTGGQEVDP